MELREQIEASALDAPARQTTEQLVAMVSVDSAKQQVIKAIVDSEPVGSWPYLVAKLCVAFGIDKNAILPVTTVDNQRMNEGSSR